MTPVMFRLGTQNFSRVATLESDLSSCCEGKLDSKLALYSRYKVLIIDEIGYMPIDKMSANLLFQLINKRYERRSTIITTNKALNKWGEMFNDNVMANAILDRLLHHSHIINITGKSYRMKDVLMESQDKSD